MQILPDMITERPDEYELMVVEVHSWMWETYGIYQTRSEAVEAAAALDPRRYRKAAIKPQIRAYRPFQTHVMQEVRVGK
jgi:hypothetical protein